MTDQENINVESQQENVGANTDYIEALKEMKMNTVSKEDYNRLKEENKKLLQAVVNGEEIELEKQKPADIGELRKKFFSAETTLDGVSAALDLRDAIMKAGGDDPFLPAGKKIAATEEDIRAANKVAEGFRYCVDMSDGDPQIFSAYLGNITNDVKLTPRKKK